MVNKPDDNIDLIETALATTVGPHSRRTTACPGDYDYWALIDDETLLSDGTLAHMGSCTFCQSMIRQMILGSLEIPMISTPEYDHSDELINQKLSQPTAICIQLESGHLVSIRNPFQEIQTYRSASTESISVSERTSFGYLELTFVASEEDKIELLVRVMISPKSQDLLEAELWQGDKILRSLPIDSGHWNSLSGWPKGDYQLVVTATGTRQFTIDVRFI